MDDIITIEKSTEFKSAILKCVDGKYTVDIYTYNKDIKSFDFVNDIEKDKVINTVFYDIAFKNAQKCFGYLSESQNDKINKGINIFDIIEIKETCIQTGMPCGVTCFSEDTCKKSLFVYFKESTKDLLSVPLQITPSVYDKPDKPFIVSNVRAIFKEWNDPKDPISFSKMVEKFNDIAFEFYKNNRDE